MAAVKAPSSGNMRKAMLQDSDDDHGCGKSIRGAEIGGFFGKAVKESV